MACPATTPGAIAALVQGALVDLFDAYGVALAPTLLVRRDDFQLHEVTAMIGFIRAAPGDEACQSGRLTLSMPSSVFGLIKDDAACTAERDDWARELTNQLMGRIKNRLLQLGATLQIGLPLICPCPHDRQQASAGLQLYTGATIGGDVLVALEGMPEESELSGTEPEGLALEGDAIFF